MTFEALGAFQGRTKEVVLSSDARTSKTSSATSPHDALIEAHPTCRHLRGRQRIRRSLSRPQGTATPAGMSHARRREAFPCEGDAPPRVRIAPEWPNRQRVCGRVAVTARRGTCVDSN